MERIRLNGFQDRRLEVGKKGDKPTDGKTPRAVAYKALMESATFHTMRLEGSGGTPEQQEASQEALRAIRGDVVRRRHNLEAFDTIVRDNVEIEKRKAQEEAEDERLVEETFSERQAFIGEIPIVNFGWREK